MESIYRPLEPKNPKMEVSNFAIQAAQTEKTDTNKKVKRLTKQQRREIKEAFDHEPGCAIPHNYTQASLVAKAAIENAQANTPKTVYFDNKYGVRELLVSQPDGSVFLVRDTAFNNGNNISKPKDTPELQRKIDREVKIASADLDYEHERLMIEWPLEDTELLQ